MASITDSIVVSSLELDIDALLDWREVLNALPIGVGLKGGVARKILKVLSGRKRRDPDFEAEMNGDGDIDLLIAVDQVTPDLRLRLRKHFAGKDLGGTVVQAKDVEVCDNMSAYFRTRDVTMNECLALRVAKDGLVLYYTQQAENDIAASIIRPSIHCLHNGFHQVWQYGLGKRVVLAPHVLARCILRWLKGHGTYYGIGPSTWLHYQERGLKAQDIFRLFRHFVDDDEKFQRCIHHLRALRLVSCWADPNELWGTALCEVNRALACYGQRLTLGEPDAVRIEEWIARKEREYRQWQYERRSKQAMGIPIEPALEAPVYLPDGLCNFPAFHHTSTNNGRFLSHSMA